MQERACDRCSKHPLHYAKAQQPKPGTQCASPLPSPQPSPAPSPQPRPGHYSLCLPAVQQLGADLQRGSQEVAVAGLVLTPVLEVLEQGVQLVVGVALQVAVDGDVAPVANLLRQVGGVDDVLGLEVGVLPVLGQEAKIQGQVEVCRGSGEQQSAGQVSTCAGLLEPTWPGFLFVQPCEQSHEQRHAGMQVPTPQWPLHAHHIHTHPLCIPHGCSCKPQGTHRTGPC